MSDNKDQTDEEHRIRAWHVALLLAGIVALHAASGFTVIWFIDGWSERGQFGDLFGAINALFSGLAFAGVIVTILLQREELRLQRLELQETRKELRRSAAAQEASEQALRAQAGAAEQSAKLNSINYLLDFYQKETAMLTSRVMTTKHPDYIRLQQISEKIGTLTRELEGMYDVLAGETKGEER